MSASPSGTAGRRELRDLLIAHHRDAYAWARHCCRSDRSEAEDVLQATYLKVLDGRARFDGRAAFRTWLFAVIHRTAADERRRRAFRELLALRWGAEPMAREPVPAADASAECSERRERLVLALARLSPRQRHVLQLVFYHELSVEDAAQVLAIGLGSARQHYARGKQRLRDLLGEAT